MDTQSAHLAFDTCGFYQRAGEAPGDVIASRESPEPASRKLCAYPEHSHYVGGDEASPDSYECQ